MKTHERIDLMQEGKRLKIRVDAVMVDGEKGVRYGKVTTANYGDAWRDLHSGNAVRDYYREAHYAGRFGAMYSPV